VTLFRRGYGEPLNVASEEAGKPMRSLERFLIGLDSWPWNAIARVGIGLSIPPVFRVLSGSDDSVWTFLALFIGLLIGLRLGPILLRLALPFSAQTREVWSERRALGKRYDSYQWQKLFWIGLGLLPYVLFGKARTAELAATIICLLGGSLGLLIWRRVNPASSA
jgi:hypothetical protein